jgi:hypothetical protein
MNKAASRVQHQGIVGRRTSDRGGLMVKKQDIWFKVNQKMRGELLQLEVRKKVEEI